MIMAGGTGGHVFPGLAVADHLRGQGWRVVWLGTEAGMERRLVPARGYPMETIRFSGLRGKGALAWLLLPLALLIAFWQSARAIFRVRPDVVLGMGGYPAFPGGMMAALFLKPLAIHEQNSVAGLANRVLALVADRVLVAFPDPFKPRAEGGGMRAEGKRRPNLSSLIPHPSSLHVVGNPVRAEIAALPAPEERFAGRSGRLRLLVLGGSLGAQALNTAVPRALSLVPEPERPIVRHQSGEKHIEPLGRAYAAAGVDAEPVAFIEDMAGAYAEADLVICRAGALTVAELAAAGVASVLVPFPHAVDDHQSVNARFLSDRGAAVLLPQVEMDPERLAQILRSLDRAKLLEMAKAARALGRPEAVRKVARHCEELAK